MNGIEKMMKYDRIMNFVIGTNETEEKLQISKYVVEQFLKFGEQTIYVIRYKSNIRKQNLFIKDLEELYPNNVFKVTTRNIYIDNKLFAWIIPLSSWQNEKSNTYPEVSTVIYDDFVKSSHTTRYINNEPTALLNMLDTAFRTRDNVKCFCLSENSLIMNPYFIYFGVVPDVRKKYNLYENIMVYSPESEEGVIDNTLKDKSNMFIETKTKESVYSFSFIYNGERFGLWVDVDKNKFYVSEQYRNINNDIFTMNNMETGGSLPPMTEWKRSYCIYKMIERYKIGRLFYENSIIRKKVYNMFSKMTLY